MKINFDCYDTKFEEKKGNQHYFTRVLQGF